MSITHYPTDPEYEALVPALPAELGLPHEAWWPGQRLTTGRVVHAFQSGYSVVMLNAPTGSGKTVISAAVARILGCKALTCTHTKALQDQYKQTASWAVTAKGKNNFPCDHPEREFAGSVLQTLGVTTLNTEQCDEYLDCADPWRYGCRYFQQVREVAESDLAVLNYAYATRVVQPATRAKGLCTGPSDESRDYGGCDWEEHWDFGPTGQPKHYAECNPFRRQLAILDEGHLANDAIVDAFALDFWIGTLKRVGLPAPTGDIADWKQWAQAARVQVGDRTLDEDLVLRRRVQVLRERLAALAAINPADWIAKREGGACRAQPIWAREVYGRFLQHFNQVLIMSATLGSPQLLADRLGIESDDVAYIDVPSIFPTQNRPVFYWPVVRLSNKSDEGDYVALASAIDFITKQPLLAGRKGIVHTPSYELVARLKDHLGLTGRWIFHTQPNARETCVSLFRDVSHPWVIVTPSLATGFDLPYEIGFQIIAKVPFAHLGDPLVRARRDYQLPNDPRFGKRCYDDDAMNQIVQAAGRCVRAPDDVGVTYILDEHFWPLHRRAHSPEYFRQALHWMP